MTMYTTVFQQIAASLVLLIAIGSTAVAQSGSQLTGGDSAPRLTETLIGARTITLVSQPNPFVREAAIGYVIPTGGRVVLDVLDGRNEIVITLFNDYATAGEHALRWDGRDASGRPVPEGPYEYRLRLIADNGLVSVTNARTIRLGR